MELRLFVVSLLLSAHRAVIFTIVQLSCYTGFLTPSEFNWAYFWYHRATVTWDEVRWGDVCEMNPPVCAIIAIWRARTKSTTAWHKQFVSHRPTDLSTSSLLDPSAPNIAPNRICKYAFIGPSSSRHVLPHKAVTTCTQVAEFNTRRATPARSESEKLVMIICIRHRKRQHNNQRSEEEREKT